MIKQQAAHGRGSRKRGGANFRRPRAARVARGRQLHFGPRWGPENDGAANSFQVSVLSPLQGAARE
eukprot:9166997-Pyramimonas_sp.AAC.1